MKSQERIQNGSEDHVLYDALMAFRLCALMVVIAFQAGCDDRSTTFTYSPPLAPLSLGFSVGPDGQWAVSGGIVTPYGTFGIEQSFPESDDHAYIVLRDRSKGTDQVFEIADSGGITLHAVGDHKISIVREGRRWIIDVDSLSGSLNVEVKRIGQEIGRVKFASAAHGRSAVITSDGYMSIVPPTTVFHDNKFDLKAVTKLEAVSTGSSVQLNIFYLENNQEKTDTFNFGSSDNVLAGATALAVAVREVKPGLPVFVIHNKLEQLLGMMICGTPLCLCLVFACVAWMKKSKSALGAIFGLTLLLFVMSTYILGFVKAFSGQSTFLIP